MTLVTIVHQHLYNLTPIIFHFKDKITHHILIFDIADKKYAEQLQRGITNLNERYKLQSTIELIELDEDSPNNIAALKERLQNYRNLTLNISGSDFALSQQLFAIVQELGGEVFAYDKEDNSYNLLPSFSNHKIDNNMKLSDFCDLLDITIVEKIDKNKIRGDRKLLEKIFADFPALFRYMDLIEDGYTHEAAKLYPKLDKAIKQKLGSINNRSQINKIFEEYLFLLFDKFDFDDLQCGVRLDFFPREANNVINEFDLLFIKNNRIGFVEIKLSKKPQNYLPLLYKNDAIMDFFGSDTISIIYALTQEKTPLSLPIAKRSQEKKITILQEDRIDTATLQRALKRFDIFPRHFLLGGQDLEMVTIKKLLLEPCGQTYSDKKLSWGAKLSSYQELFNDDEHFYGIELIEDITPPKHYSAIDHHNQFQDRPSALEQVAKILDIELGRFERLIALNDKGYIPAMQDFGASKEEIEEIRRLDRRAQGVSKKEEERAIEEIKRAQKRGNLTIVHTTLEHFSPIVDRLYPANLLIYNEEQLAYYGDKVPLLKESFKDLIQKKVAYYGGGDGFFGIAKGYATKELREKIIELVS